MNGEMSKTTGGTSPMVPGRIQPMTSGHGLEGERMPQVAQQMNRLDNEITILEELFNSLEKKLSPILNMDRSMEGQEANKEPEEKLVDVAAIIHDKRKRIANVNHALSYVLQNLEI